MVHEQHPLISAGRHGKPASFQLLFVVSFAIFATVALAGALFGAPWRTWLPGAEGVKSMTGGVKSAVYTFLSLID